MREKYKNALMWALYALLFLLFVLIQTVLFGKPRFSEVKLSLLPVVIACVSMLNGAESSAVFGLAAGLFWALTGADLGPVYVLLFSVCGAVCGYLCDRYLKRQILSALMMSLLALAICQLPAFALKCYLGGAYWRQFPLVLRQIGLSLAACLVAYPVCRIIRKAGV